MKKTKPSRSGSVERDVVAGRGRQLAWRDSLGLVWEENGNRNENLKLNGLIGMNGSSRFAPLGLLWRELDHC